MEQGVSNHLPAVEELDEVGHAVVIGPSALGDTGLAAEVRPDLHGRYLCRDAPRQGFLRVRHVLVEVLQHLRQPREEGVLALQLYVR